MPRLLLFTLLGLLSANAGAAAPPGAVTGRCTVKFFGTSTLHDFEGRAPCEAFAIEAPGENGLYHARVVVEIAKMTTDLRARDARMREMFDAERFPRIVASFDRIAPDDLRRAAAQAGPAPALAFRLAIRDEEQNVVPQLSAWSEEPDSRLRFLATFELSLHDFGLEAPSVLGLMSVGDRVRAEVDVSLTAQ